MKCPYCGSEIPDQAARCPKCGRRIIRIHPKHYCSNCGTEVPEGADRCPGCGGKINWSKRTSSPDTKRSSRNQSRIPFHFPESPEEFLDFISNPRVLLAFVLTILVIYSFLRLL